MNFPGDTSTQTAGAAKEKRMFNTLVFYCVAIFTVATAGVTVFSQNIIRSAFSLLGALIGVAALFGMMGADFLAVVQMMVYVGGVMVLILFAVMLTHRIREVSVSNKSVTPVAGGIVALATLGLLLIGIWRGLPSDLSPVYVSITPRIGENLLGAFLLPFLVAPVLLTGVLVGSVVIARRRAHPTIEKPAGSLEDKS